MLHIFLILAIDWLEVCLLVFAVVNCPHLAASCCTSKGGLACPSVADKDHCSFAFGNFLGEGETLGEIFVALLRRLRLFLFGLLHELRTDRISMINKFSKY